MIKFLKTNQGFLIICVVFSLVNKFPIISFGMVISWILFLTGLYYKEKATMEFFDALKNMETGIYKNILQAFDKHLCKASRVLKAVAHMKITTDETKMIKKLYQIRRLAYNLMKSKETKCVK